MVTIDLNELELRLVQIVAADLDLPVSKVAADMVFQVNLQWKDFVRQLKAEIVARGAEGRGSAESPALVG